ncbi:AAA family ATPase, partial [Hephaestia mangrovi]|uniref:AAA family ATPase n=1 Tax=Hephaestia mangrovi TaxID=2873268 RepID=UPI001CA709AA
VLVGDPEQLQAIEAGAAFRSVAERHGGVEITDIRRQREDWQRDATRYLATERTGEAISLYERHDRIHSVETRDEARAGLIERWDRDRGDAPGASRIILTHTNDEVRALNVAARERLRAGGELGIDVTVATERGERAFASGDRVMFLRNERSLGAKNGTLGQVQSVTPTSIAVLLDDGRAVAFDVKDYASIDHGYAATIHKAQGVTVDRVHVLATPGLDRHAAYVALSRHRDSVDLHYGRDDFADQQALTRVLSRERGKDMASDYPRVFADRRQIELPQPPRNRFASLKLRSVIPPERQPATVERTNAPRRDPIPALAREPQPDLSSAVTRHGRLVRAMLFAQSLGDKPTAEQRAELVESRAQLDNAQPDGARNLEAAFANDRELITEASKGQTRNAIQAMQLEAEMQTNPTLRADVFVRRWQTLERQRRLLLRDHETNAANTLGDRMIGMAKGLERDPQVESLLRNRRVQLGLSAHPAESVGRALGEMIGRGRSRGLGIGM